MKLSKNYSLKKSKSDEIIYFTFPFIDAHSKIWREKTTLENVFLSHEGHLFLSEIREKRPEYDNFGLFLWPSIIALYEKSSLYFKKALIFCPKTIATYIFKPLNLSKVYR
jgi:hypothetical protein